MVSFPPMPSFGSNNNNDNHLPVYSSLNTNSTLSLVPSKQPLFKRSPALTVAGGLGLIALAALVVTAGRRSSGSNNGSASWAALSLKESTSTKKVCDPHDLPGVLHISNNIDSIEGALETQWFPLNATSCPSQNYINRIASGDLTSIPSSLYNRTILLIGDSIDRANVQYTCHLLKGDYTITKPGDKYWPQANIPNNKENNKDEANVKGEEQEEDWKPNEYSERSYPTICYIKKIDLLIMNVFHFGLDKENYFTWKDQYGPPYHTELRIKEIALPLIEKVGREIDIVEFSSGLWDLARFGRQDDSSLTSESTTTIRHLTLDRLQWFSQRFEEVLSTLNMNLPNIPQRFIRRLHTSSDDDAGSFQQWWQVGGGGSDGSKHTYYFPSWRVNELNNAIEEAVRHSNNQETAPSATKAVEWQLDHWGDKLAGMELFDKGNVHPHFAATTLWLEQMLYRLVNV